MAGFYPIVFFLSAAAVASGAKVKLVNGEYIIVNPGGVGIQAINGGVPPVDQSAEVVALTAENQMLSDQLTALTAQVAQLEAALAACQAGQPPVPVAPTITNMTVTPANLPVGGGQVVIDAVVTGTPPLTLTLDGAPVTLPATVTV